MRGCSQHQPFSLRELSEVGTDGGASTLVPLQQRFLLRVPAMLRSAVFQSGLVSLSGTSTLCSGALLQQPDRKRSLIDAL